MNSSLSLLRSRAYALQPPRVLPPFLAFLAALGLAIAFGAVATAGLTERYPAWMVEAGLDGHPLLRAILIGAGTVNGLAAVLVASAFGLKTCTLAGHRLGWHPIRESEGPCRLVQDAPGLWGLLMELSSGEDPGAEWPLTLETEPRPCHLIFRLDEAAAGAVSRLYNPDEVLRVRWMDLPLAAGGPALLEISDAVRAESLERPESDRRHDLAA